MKFHENPSGRSRIVAWGKTDREKLVVAIRFADKFKKSFVKGNLELFKFLLNMTYCHCPLMEETLTPV